MNIIKYISLFLSYLFFSILISEPLFAQKDSLTQDEPYIEDLGRLPESFDMALDTLLNKRYKDYYSLSKKRKPISTEEIRNKDRLYRERINTMESAIPLTYNAVVRDAIELYVNRRSNLLSNMLTKSAYYFPIIEEALDRHNLPLELKYLAIVESALNPTAVSRMGATGLWQFMLRTGKIYGLHIDSLIDERRDPHKSSDAMCRYFKDMFALYGDWLLSIAAYNCGPGNVNKAIRRAGGSKDFWVIYPYLPRETRSYVPFFIAAFYAMEHYQEHQIRPRDIKVPLAVDTIHINTQQDFRTLSQLTKVDIDLIRELNPKYRREIVPGNNRTQVVVLPAAEAIFFAAHKDSILAHHKIKTPKNYEYSDDAPSVTTSKKIIRHRVARGETLSRVARKYGVDIEDIKKWNRLRSNRLKRGQTLKIELVTSSTPEPNIKEAAEQEPVTSTPIEESSTKPNTPVTPDVIQHKVARGETLSSISRKYGVTIDDLIKWNNLSGTQLRQGQSLKIEQNNGTGAGLDVEKGKPQKSKKAEAPKKVYHKVRKGESLYTIAQKYRGVSPNAIKRANGLKSDRIKPGQRLLIPTK